MAQALYRKHRPQRFDDGFFGQEHVRDALRHAVRDDKVGHAYLFSGPRGTGKTTTARLLAKALNCLELGADGEPCGRCENCVGIAEGTFLDLFELDAASNNSVDNVRDLTESVHLGVGATARTKVYIVDEVHMLSAAASNALLKTLEEPPRHVVFVLATTNPEKVLPTIRSRTQHFTFTLLGHDQLVDLLGTVAGEEGIELAPEVLDAIARAGAGSARDALSALDQVLALGADGPLDATRVAGLLGGGGGARLTVLDAIASEDPAEVLVELQTLVDAGDDPRRIAEDVLRAARDAFLLLAGGGRVRVEATDDERARLAATGEALGNAQLVRTVETLGQAIVDMRGADTADPRLVLEVALVRLARRDAGTPLEVLAERVSRLEEALREAPPSRAPAPAAPTGSGPKALGALRRERSQSPTPAPEEAGETPPVTPPDEPAVPQGEPAAPSGSSPDPLDVDDVILAWADLLPALPVATRSAVAEAQPVRVDGDVVVFSIPPHLAAAARPRFKKVADQVRDGLGTRLGRTLKFTLVAADSLGPAPATPAAPVGPDEATGHATSTEPPDEDVVDPSELVEAEGTDATVDSVSRLRDAFGASVVEEPDSPR